MASFDWKVFPALVALAAGCTTPVPQDRPGSAAPVHQVDSIAVHALEAHRLPGLALTVLRGDEIVLAGGYGYVDMSRADRVRETTVFQLGSISKQFLAALVLVLVDERHLSLDDPVVRHLPDFPQLPPGLRVRHLLNHTSGVRELFTAPEAQAGFDDLTRSRAELVALVRRLPVDWPPGSRWSYSNTNYTMLALLVERIMGEPYEDLLVARFFRPLGLSSLRQCASRPHGPAEAVGHVLHDGVIVAAAPENMNWIRGDGGLCGHALDVARWTRLLATGRVLPPHLYEQMVAPALLPDGSRAAYGLGLSLVDFESLRRVGHNGAMRGFSATAAYYPDSALTVVVLVHRGDVRTESIERQVVRRLLGLPQPGFREVPLSMRERQRYVGTYDIGVFDVHVVERAGRLWLEMPPPGPTTPLTYLGNHAFAGRDPDAHRVTFDDRAGAAETLRLLMGGMYWYGRRKG
ncbi:beta-lactamase family protein [Rhodocaloribacter litoris]|uniref:serine hydrolase domain-containing protein n=1 Tax=Rhodocaloribacter litoris TaxID=2558931 RepID=UPI0014237405|nr:serine hydrolase domain-containing protein [Rhodocaloribacter litoris]QXD15821.1 beta-lactamase family protein [Rhodocaloribacter litoris]